MKDLAEETGVSASTVSLVLNNKGTVAEETRRQVQEAAKRLGYVHRPRRAADRKLLGLVVDALPYTLGTNAFISRLIAGVEKEAARNGYHVVFSIVDEDHSNADGASNTTPPLPPFMQTRDVDGVIVVSGGNLTDEYLHRLSETDIPLVLVNNYLYHQPIPSVTIDGLRAGFQLTSHLISLGHRRIGFVRGAKASKSLLEREQGYSMALSSHQLHHDPELIPPRRSEIQMKGYEETQELLRLPDPPTAIIAACDRTAVNALRALKDEGLSVPHDMALASFGDMPEAANQDPPLTTMRIRKEEMGATAVQHLFRMIEDSTVSPVNIQVYSDLVIRESCGAQSQTSVSVVG